MPEITATSIDKAKTWLESLFHEAWDIRRNEWKPLAQRRLMPNIPPQVSDAAKQVPVLSPLLEDNLSADVQIATQNDSEVDLIPKDESQEAKDDIEDVRLYLEIQKNRMNHGKLFDQSVTTHQVWPSGVAIARLEAIRPPEPDLEHEPDETYQRARDIAFKQSEHQCFRLHTPNPFTCFWGPKFLDEEFTDFIEVATVDAYFADDYKRRSDGQTVRDILKEKGVTLSAGRDQEEQGAAQGTDEFTICFYECHDKEEDCWYRYEYVYQAGGNLKDNGVELDKIKLPHKRSSYFVIPAGTSNFTEASDPHRMFRPKLYSLGVLVEQKNMWTSLSAALAYAVQSTKGVYARIPANITDEGRRLIENLAPGILSMEGAGSDATLVIDVPERSSNQLLVFGGAELRSWPGMLELLEVIHKQLDRLDKELAEYRTNPFLTGRAFSEYREGTGTAASLGTQSAAIPYGSHRTQLDTAWEKILRTMVNCIISWDEEVEPGQQKMYYGTATGNERKYEAGKMVKLTPEKAKRHFDIKVSTLVETQQERLIREQESWANWQRRAITWEKHLKNLGYPDPRKTSKELAEEGYLIDAERDFVGVMQSRRNVLAQTLTGLNLQAIGERAAMMLQNPMQGALQPPQQGSGQMDELPRSDRKPGGPPALDGVQSAGGGGF